MIHHAVEPVNAFVVMESEGPWIKPKIKEVVDRANLFYVTFETILQALDRFNRNKRMYRSKAIIPALNAPHLIELRRKKAWYGCNGHPKTQDPQLVLNIDMDKVCHIVESVDVRGDLVHGVVSTLNDKQWGLQMTGHVLQGIEQSFSLRALASIRRDSSGRGLVETPPHIVCYDRVSLPSHPEAYQIEGGDIKFISSSMPNCVVQEAFAQELTEEAAHKIIMESAANFAAEESQNFKDIVNFFGVAYESIGFNTEGTALIVKDTESKRTYTIGMESYVYNQVSDIFSKISGR